MGDKVHIVLCSGADEQWQLAMKNLTKWLRENNTDWVVTNALIEDLERWHQGPTSPGKTSTLSAADPQSIIGWSYVHDGWLATSWWE